MEDKSCCCGKQTLRPEEERKRLMNRLSHIRHCVVRDVKNGDEEVIDELVATIQKLMK